MKFEKKPVRYRYASRQLPADVQPGLRHIYIQIDHEPLETLYSELSKGWQGKERKSAYRLLGALPAGLRLEKVSSGNKFILPTLAIVLLKIRAGFLASYVITRILLRPKDVGIGCTRFYCDNIRLDDCFYAALLRSGGDGFLHLNRTFASKLYLFIKAYLYNSLVLSKEIRNSSAQNETLLLSLIEPTYMNHALRRLAYSLTNDLLETAWSPFHAKLVIFRAQGACGFRKITLDVERQEITASEISLAQKAMNERLFHGTQAHTGNIEDIDTNISIAYDTSRVPSPNLRTVILYLHQTADQQYVFGADDFGDIASFHDFVIQRALNNNLQLILKPHPNSFNLRFQDKTIIEKAYLSRLLAQHGFRETIDEACNHTFSNSALHDNLFFANSKLSLASIKKHFGECPILLITKHGNIVLEALAMNIDCAISKQSRFRNFTFRLGYQNMSELESLIQLFAHGRLSTVNIPSCDEWSYVMACTLKTRKLPWNTFVDIYSKEQIKESTNVSTNDPAISPPDWASAYVEITEVVDVNQPTFQDFRK